MRCPAYRVAGFLALFLSASAAHAQWTVANLHPSSSSNVSRAYATSDAQQVGNFASFAARWNSSAASYTSLGGIGVSNGSGGFATSGGRVAGINIVQFATHAVLWTGSGASLNAVDLNPAGSPVSQALGIDATYVVGGAQIGNALHAGRWGTTAASFVDLHPAGQTGSVLTGIHNGQMSGYMSSNNIDHAGLWPNSPAVIDLHPAGATASQAMAIHNGQQVGNATIGGAPHAALWSGSAASFVDLTPPGLPGAVANGVFMGRQVGASYVGNLRHAGTWTGTAASWQDLSTFLPGAWEETVAFGVWQSADYVYVCGYGYNSATLREEALLWTRPTCSSAPIITMQPMNANSCDGESAVFSVAAASTGTTAYQWQIRAPFGPPAWTDLMPGPQTLTCGGQASATPVPGNPAAATITVIGCPGPFQVRVLISNPCGGTFSNAANLTFNTPCPADYNCSGTVNVQDIFDFLAGWFAQDPRANFNHTGGITVQDIFDFLARWFTGC